MFDAAFYKGKKVFITGHTGFKGSWMCKLLSVCGAEVMGYALEPSTDPSLFVAADIQKNVDSVIGDIRDYEKLHKTLNRFAPEIVIHMAAQPIVRESYKNPMYTYETNVMGTVNLMESIRHCDSVRSVVNVTTDKVYKNNEWEWGYRETDPLDGYDPYSNSKSCSELVTSSYKNSFFADRPDLAVSTARAGNVIGGGDFSVDRIIPDCIRAAVKGEQIIVRNPYSTRPYQHVLEPVTAYLMIAQKQYEEPRFSGNYNIGPDDCDCVTTGRLADLFCEKWGGISWKNISVGGPHEANFLKLDCSRIKSVYRWSPRWHIDQAVEKTVEWSKCYYNDQDVGHCMIRQFEEYELI